MIRVSVIRRASGKTRGKKGKTTPLLLIERYHVSSTNCREFTPSLNGELIEVTSLEGRETVEATTSIPITETQSRRIRVLIGQVRKDYPEWD